MNGTDGGPNRRRWIAVLACLAILSGAVLVVSRHSGGTGMGADPYRSIGAAECNPPVLPAGQAHPSGEREPLRPVWCYELASMPLTRTGGSNGWLDDFNTRMEMGRLDDGDMGYRVFEDIDHRGALQSRAFVNQNHWMVDLAGGSNGGMLLRPDRSFRFERGKLVVESDVAAAIPEYGDSASVEIDVSTASAPTGRVVDAQYGYGLFGGHWTFGCRFQPDRKISCAMFNASGRPGEAAVFGNELGRVWQMLPFQPVGAMARGGTPSPDTDAHFRSCRTNQMDLYCRDRLRLELTRDSVKVFVNGRPYFEQSGMAPQHQFPDEFLNSELYVYFTSWVNRPLATAYRCHWDRLAINPVDAAGRELPPSTSPSYGLALPR